MRLVTAEVENGSGVYVQDDAGMRQVRTGDGGSYTDVRAWLAAGEVGLADGRRALQAAPEAAPQVILRPVLEPGAVICVGLNYRSHILEMGRELPQVPTLFSKLARSLTDPYAEIAMPAYSAQLDFEAELAVVIGTGGRDIAVARAWEAVGGLTVINDMSVRDWQWRTPQWFAGKAGQRLSPVGPAVVTADEFPDGIDALRLTLSVNGTLCQNARLGDLVFGVPELIADVSRIVELHPGDIIATGTPGGVAAGAAEPRWLQVGDVVETTVEQLGTLRNTIVS